MDGGSSGGAGSKQQSGSERGLQRGADPSGKGDVPPKQPKNSVIGFLRQRLSAAETPTAEPARKPALKSQLADKSKCALDKRPAPFLASRLQQVPIFHLTRVFVSAGQCPPMSCKGLPARGLTMQLSPGKRCRARRLTRICARVLHADLQTQQDNVQNCNTKHFLLRRTAMRRDERKRARGRDSSGHDDMQEPVRKRQVGSA
jgi:hypothetical protein